MPMYHNKLIKETKKNKVQWLQAQSFTQQKQCMILNYGLPQPNYQEQKVSSPQ